MLTSVAFDTLDYFDKLMAAGVPDAQARVQAEFLRDQVEQQTGEIRRAIEKYDESRRAELATKGDVQDVRLEIEKVRSETEKVRAETEKIRLEIRETEARLTTNIEQVRAETEKIRLEIKETEARLRTDMEKVKYALLKWQIGGWLALAAIMAKGFGWIGF